MYKEVARYYETNSNLPEGQNCRIYDTPYEGLVSKFRQGLVGLDDRGPMLSYPLKQVSE